eukprot:Nk52_evm19s2449 gene=Nk52_evmTU19s2449
MGESEVENGEEGISSTEEAPVSTESPTDSTNPEDVVDQTEEQKDTPQAEEGEEEQKEPPTEGEEEKEEKPRASSSELAEGGVEGEKKIKETEEGGAEETRPAEEKKTDSSSEEKEDEGGDEEVQPGDAAEEVKEEGDKEEEKKGEEAEEEEAEEKEAKEEEVKEGEVKEGEEKKKEVKEEEVKEEEVKEEEVKEEEVKEEEVKKKGAKEEEAKEEEGTALSTEEDNQVQNSEQPQSPELEEEETASKVHNANAEGTKDGDSSGDASVRSSTAAPESTPASPSGAMRVAEEEEDISATEYHPVHPDPEAEQRYVERVQTMLEELEIQCEQHELGYIDSDDESNNGNDSRAQLFRNLENAPSAAAARTTLGLFFYERGDYDLARMHFEVATGQGNEAAQYYLGMMYYDGNLNKTCGVFGHSESGEGGHSGSNAPAVTGPNAGAKLTKEQKDALEKIEQDNIVRGLAYMRSVALSKNPLTPPWIIHQACFNLGCAYYEGQGTRLCEAEALKWWLKAAGGEEITMKRMEQIAVPRRPRQVKVVKTNLPQAPMRASRGSMQTPTPGYEIRSSPNPTFMSSTPQVNLRGGWNVGNKQTGAYCVPAMTQLGLFYASRGEFQDMEKALVWHLVAAEHGSIESMGVLGILYDKGSSKLLGRPPPSCHASGSINVVNTSSREYVIKKDPTAAAKWYKEAAKRGNVWAQANLGIYYYSRQMYIKSVEWLKTAAEQSDVDGIKDATNCRPDFIKKGISTACFYYALCFERGHGVLQNMTMASKWYQKAAVFDRDAVADLRAEVDRI